MSNTTPTSAPTGQNANQRVAPLLAAIDLRDYFAAKAIPCAYKYWMEDYYHPQSENGAENEERTGLAGSMDRIAEYAYDLADAMLAERDRK